MKKAAATNETKDATAPLDHVLDDCDNEWPESDVRRIAEELYQLTKRVCPAAASSPQQHFDAGYLTAAREMLELAFVCDGHRQEDSDRRINDRLLAALAQPAR